MKPIDPDPIPERSHVVRRRPATGTPGDDGAGEHVRTLRDYVNLARRYRWLLGLASLMGLAVAGWMVVQDRPEFRARSVIRMVEDEPQLPTGMQVVGGRAGGGTDWVTSQIQVLRSRTVLGEVVDSVGLQIVILSQDFPRRLLRVEEVGSAASDTFELRFHRDGYEVRDRDSGRIAYGRPVQLAEVRLIVEGDPGIEEAGFGVRPRIAAIEALERQLSARTREMTNVVDLEFVAHDPSVAESVVNQTALVFQALSRHGAQEEARRRRVFVEEQLTQTESLLAEAQLRFSDFRRREQLYSSQEAFAARQAGLMSVDVRREELLADRRMLAGLVDRLRRSEGEARARGLRSLMGTPDLGTNPAVSALITQVIELQAVRDSLTTGDWARASSHPDVRRIDSLLDDARTGLLQAVDSHLDVLDARIAAVEGLRERYAAEMDQLPSVEAEEGRLAQEVESLADVADLLRQELQRARIAEAVEGGEVEIVDLAAGATPLPSNRARRLFLGLLVGLLAGGGAALLADSLNSSIRGKGELEQLLRLPALAVIPQLRAVRRANRLRQLPASVGGDGSNGKSAAGSLRSHELVTAADNGSSGAEAYRTLRTNLIFSRSVGNLRRVVVTSPSAAEGKTTTVANLGVTFAQQGMRVLLVDGDLRRARLHEIFQEAREPGLTQWVLGHASEADVIRTTAIPGLHVLPAGFLPPNPSELVGGEEMARAMAALEKQFDLILVDSPPLGAASDAAILGSRAQGVLLVIQAGGTERQAAVNALHQLDAVGAHTLGTVLNDPEGKIPAYGGYGYYTPNYYRERG